MITKSQFKALDLTWVSCDKSGNKTVQYCSLEDAIIVLFSWLDFVKVKRARV